MTKRTITPNETSLGHRADVWLAEELALSRSAAAGLLDGGNVLLEGKAVRKNDRVQNGAYLVTLPDPRPLEAKPEPIPLDVVYEDGDLLVVNKPRGMVVHPAAGNEEGTLVNALLYHCGGSLSGINGVLRPGIVHRIDKDTSGLLIVAKSDRAHTGLAEQIKEHSFARSYECLAYGRFREETGILSFPIGRHPVDRKKMAVVPDGRNAVTRYRVKRVFIKTPVSHLRLDLETGRTHQIRVHLSHVGHPILGDPVYASRASEKLFPELGGQCLHAKFISFTHPVTGETLSFESPLPDYFREVLDKLLAIDGENAE